jgi:hypothetical protein
MNFSFVLPTLGEYNRLKKMFDSFERTTKYKDKIEFLLAVDTGNTGFIKTISERKYSFKIQFFERDKTDDFTNGYYNWLADRTVGKNIITFNDDAWMRTNHWDAKILKKIHEIGRTVYFIEIPDTARIKYQNLFPCFPCVSRRAFCTLGFALCPDIRMFPADKVTYAIYRHAGLTYTVNNVLIEHEHELDYTGSKKRMMDIFLEDNEKQSEVDIGDYIWKLLLVKKNDHGEPSKLQRIINIIKEK